MNEGIGKILKKTREEKHLTREDVCEGIITPDTLRAVEAEEREESYWVLRALLGRLHVLDSAVIFHLDHKENQMVNMEIELYRDLLLWRYDEAESKLMDFYQLCNKKDFLQLQIYYRLHAMLRKRQNKITEEDQNEIQGFVEQAIPCFEERLKQRRLFSPDELALLIEYYECTVSDTAGRMKKLYLILTYVESEYANIERAYSFYAVLKYCFAKCQYEMREYEGCIRQCKDGLKVSEYFRVCYLNAELYELMADAQGEIEKEASKLQQANENSIKAIVRNYMLADTVYDTFYHGYHHEHSENINRKIELWKTMISHKIYE